MTEVNEFQYLGIGAELASYLIRPSFQADPADCNKACRLYSGQRERQHYGLRGHVGLYAPP